MTTVCTGWMKKHEPALILHDDGKADGHVSHGMCPACSDALLAQMPAPRPAGPWDANHDVRGER